MCKGTIVVEAGEKSGSIITAKNAIKQGRDIFAVPGEIFNKKHAGTNYLINNGAVPVFGVSDVIDYYSDIIMELNGGIIPEVNSNFRMNDESHTEKKIQVTWETVKKEPPVRKKQEKAQLPDFATENAKKLYGIITEDAKTADEYVIETGMSVQDVLSAITELELYGIVMMHSGKRYGLKIN